MEMAQISMKFYYFEDSWIYLGEFSYVNGQLETFPMALTPGSYVLKLVVDKQLVFAATEIQTELVVEKTRVYLEILDELPLP